MKAFVTGSTGFIGSQVVDYLLERGYEVVCSVRKTSNLRWLKDKPVELAYASLNDFDALKKALSDRGKSGDPIDYIFHIAGLTAAKDDATFMKVNRDGAANLLRAIDESGLELKRYLHISSLTVSGPAASLDRPITEDMPYNPISGYGRSKKAGEDIVHKYMDKFPVTIIRPHAVYGPRDEDIYGMFKCVKYGLGPTIGFSSKYVSLIHSFDLARGIIEAAESPATVGETYNLASEHPYSWDEIMPAMHHAVGSKIYVHLPIPHSLVLSIAWLSGTVSKALGHPSIFNYEKGQDFIQKFWIASIEKAKRDFGFSQKISLEDGMKLTADWYKQNKWL